MQKKIAFFFILFFVLFAQSMPAKNYYVIDGWQEDNGIIKMWYMVLGLLDEYDKGLNAGFEISFNGDGKYYTEGFGHNWWNYYFAFTSIGSTRGSNIVRVPRYKRSLIRFNTLCTITPERAHYLLTKYMQVNAQVLERYEKIKRVYFADDILTIGVFYQQPMMAEVQNDWGPVSLCNRVQQECNELDGYRILLFTSLDGYAQVFQDYFGSEYYPITHIVSNVDMTPLRRGENELLTLLLLSNCSMVIAPGSYQGMGAQLLNPALKLVELDTISYACL